MFQGFKDIETLKRETLKLAVGAVAQLGERLVCNQEATGSIPVSSTRIVARRPAGRNGRKLKGSNEGDLYQGTASAVPLKAQKKETGL